ncbi:hypothetical protein FVER53590_29386 [Fusarium verticillioides]|nr:hypothetical protein FVER53590_29386 [Fusarium verticillioides]
MVHSFSDLSHEEDGYDNDWFREGIAKLYSAYLPYRFGFRDKAFLIESLNRHLQGYFSSPRISMDIREAGEEIFLTGMLNGYRIREVALIYFSLTAVCESKMVNVTYHTTGV